jgi:hypothetical protein
MMKQNKKVRRNLPTLLPSFLPLCIQWQVLGYYTMNRNKEACWGGL